MGCGLDEDVASAQTASTILSVVMGNRGVNAGQWSADGHCPRAAKYMAAGLGGDRASLVYPAADGSLSAIDC
ncbi:MAG: hypothetical protein AAF651_04445, partial [Cyanobacteria bacterium P01_C01_bin.73]